MKPLLTTLALLASTLVARPAEAQEPSTHERAYTVADSLAAIRWVSQKWHVSYGWLLRVARCESGLNATVTNPSSGAMGLFQIIPATWAYWARQVGENRSPYNPYGNANVAAWAFSRGNSFQWDCR